MTYQDTFQQRLEKLNTAQKQAVETIFGPVMVIAGPGTGKTEILAARIANILQSEEAAAEPHNILCLTYTDAGTIAMRKRLLSFIGPVAHQVQIHTFHSFCNEIIQQNLDYFGKRELQHVSDLEKLGYLEQIVDSFGASHPLFKKSGYFEARRLQNLFDTMKSENWTTEEICNAADEYIADLPNREGFTYKRANKTKNIEAGDPNQRLIDAEVKKMEALKAGAKEFSKYEALMKENHKYDFQDMIAWVAKAFKENEEILARYQEQFQYILVDEYQDTNGTQNDILTSLTSYWDDPNLFIVGDDDQSIYRFQGANLRNILDVYERFQSNISTIVLTENYRSSQNILDTSKYLIERNTERLTSVIPNLEKSLNAQNPNFGPSEVKPTITEYENIAHEEASIVEQIEQLQSQGIDLSEVAVIYSQHSQAANIIKSLELKKIPLNVKTATNILELPLIEKLVTMLNYLQKEFESPNSGESFLFQIMHYDFFGLNPRQIARISTGIQQLKKEAKEAEQEFNISWRDLLANQELLEKVGITNTEDFLNFSQKIELWIQSIANLTFQELVEKIMSQSGMINGVMQSKESTWNMRVLTSFFNFVKEESKIHNGLTIQQFLQTLKQMREHGLRLPVSKIIANKSGINFVTAHSSKGLEYKYVFLIGANSKVWDTKGRSITQFTFPDTLTKSNDGDHTQEARRLFFVAITRAKEFLYISYNAKTKEGKELEASRFITEIQESMGIHEEHIALNDEQITMHELSLMQEQETEKQNNIDHELLDELLKNYKMSATHLNKYLKCPLSFYYENVLRVPAALNEYMAFGTAIHYALEHFFRNIKDGQLPEKSLLPKLFHKSMNLNQSSFTDEQFKRRKEYGEELLNGLYEDYKDSWNTNVKVEYGVFNASYNSIPLSGKLDKIEFLEDGTINVVDYKTGKYSRARNKLLPPNDEVNPDGGDYWRQIIFYKILLDNDSRQNWIMSSGEMDFVEKEKDEYKKVKLPVHPQHEEIVKQQIQEVYQNIKDHKFDGCGEDDCNWCHFQKQVLR